MKNTENLELNSNDTSSYEIKGYPHSYKRAIVALSWVLLAVLGSLLIKECSAADSKQNTKSQHEIKVNKTL
jgi:hypothetical protein